MKPVEHPGPASGNPGASRSCRCRAPPWRRRNPWGSMVGVADASVASARRAQCAQTGCIGIDGRPHAASPFGQPASRRGRSSAGRGRSGCTAAPARGTAHTRTGGRNARPGGGSSGASSPRPPRPSRCHALRWTMTSGNATLAPHSLLACVGYGVRFNRCQANGRHRARLLRARRSFYRRRSSVQPSRRRLFAARLLDPRTQAVNPSPTNDIAWEAALQGGLPGEPTPGQRSVPAWADFAQRRTASSPPNRRGS
jgi:hypothetical protein